VSRHQPSRQQPIERPEQHGRRRDTVLVVAAGAVAVALYAYGLDLLAWLYH
jgi:hypothetical protein